MSINRGSRRSYKSIIRALDARAQRRAYNAGMQCNIDANGKKVRFIGGSITTLIGLVLLGLALGKVIEGGWVWPVVVITLLSGAFQIFEARAGWCVVRAMGFKTPV